MFLWLGNNACEHNNKRTAADKRRRESFFFFVSLLLLGKTSMKGQEGEERKFNYPGFLNRESNY